jgi:peroxiredoxin-like protein
MQELPHHYRVNITGDVTNHLKVTADNLPDMQVAPPLLFDGPGDQWSPEDLLMSSVASCLILSFRAIARISKLDWLSIQCECTGELNRVERKTCFTHIHLRVMLELPADGNVEKAEKLLHKAEETCLITNSLACATHLESEIITISVK